LMLDWKTTLENSEILRYVMDTDNNKRYFKMRVLLIFTIKSIP